jgi:hypothetical protein
VHGQKQQFSVPQGDSVGVLRSLAESLLAAVLLLLTLPVTIAVAIAVGSIPPDLCCSASAAWAGTDASSPS